ncbi:MAG: ISNCY family transposase, partial [Acidobacteriaceae bacterium]|nr:ISNCY family transposase [Acidobacteriaceae bacterium]
MEARRSQLSFADGFIQEAVEDLWEPWMRHADQALNDDALLTLIQQELMKRCKKSKTRGRKATPVEVILRMMLLKHVRDWSFEILSREVRANLVYREFTRVGGNKVPDEKTMGNLARQIGPELVEKLHKRFVEIAKENRIVAGQKMRLDTTVVETNIHYPTDSTLLGDGVRVLTRLMKRVTQVAGKVGTKLRDRSRSVKLKVLAIARASRNKTKAGQEKMKAAYLKLIAMTSRVVGDARKFSREIAGGTKKGTRKVLQRTKKQLDQMIVRVQRVLHQTRERVIRGNTKTPNKVFSVFEIHTELIRKGKAHKENEFGQLVLVQEAENQIITHYQVCDQRPADSTLFVPALEKHIELFGTAPKAVAADPGFFSAANEAKAEELGVKRISIPSLGTKSKARKEKQKRPWFKELQKWRTGCEGRISVLKRRHGLERSRYKGPDGMKRWVGLGVIADTVIQIGTQLAKQVAT